MPDSTCAFVGCASDLIYARGLCREHYMREYRDGNLERYARVRRGDSARASTCAYCQESFVSRRKSKARGGAWTRCCSKSCARRLELDEGTHQFQVKPRYGQWTAGGDPDRERERLRIKGERTRRARRARLAQVESEPYMLAEIAERDGFRCGICRRAVDMSLAWPHPKSPSVDHIVPLSRGGDDTRANVRLAHFRCNLSKGNRVEWGQQLLIG